MFKQVSPEKNMKLVIVSFVPSIAPDGEPKIIARFVLCLSPTVNGAAKSRLK